MPKRKAIIEEYNNGKRAESRLYSETKNETNKKKELKRNIKPIYLIIICGLIILCQRIF
jgi:hypothetical protein